MMTSSLVALPEPVTRWLELVLPDESQVASARIRWQGHFRMKPGARWVPFVADERIAARPPSFVWDADLRVFPGLHVRVRDSYDRGMASVRARLADRFTLADQLGSRALAESALGRWIGEAVWIPDALLPVERADYSVSWQPVDDDVARVRVRDGAISASAEFRFGGDGMPRRLRSMRWRDVDGRLVHTPFEATYGDFVRRGGYFVPGDAEVAWLLSEGRWAYWRGSPVDVEYDFEP